MNKYILDTMTLVLRLENRKMPSILKVIFQQAEDGHAEILVPSVAIFELAYLAEKNRIKTNLDKLKDYFEGFITIKEEPLTMEIITESFQITDIPELHDRLIAGYGRVYAAEVLTNDPKIRASSFVKTRWDSE